MHHQQLLMEMVFTGFDDNEDVGYLKNLEALNVYGWTKNQVDVRNVFAKENFNIKPPQWVGLKFFNVYGNNEYHKDNMISIVLKTYFQIKKVIKLTFLNRTKKVIKTENKKETLFMLKIV